MVWVRSKDGRLINLDNACSVLIDAAPGAMADNRTVKALMVDGTPASLGIWPEPEAKRVLEAISRRLLAEDVEDVGDVKMP